MNYESARQWLRSVAGKHLPANARNYKFKAWLGERRTNMLGGTVLLDPVEGKVVEKNDDYLLIKERGNEFCIVATALVSGEANVGDKVQATFYQLRRLDGTRADGRDDPAVNGVHRFMLTGAETKLNVATENPYLRDLIEQLEKLPTKDGYRKIANVIVDAGAKEVTAADDSEESLSPHLRFNARNKKFVGEVRIIYHRGSDDYEVQLIKDGEVVERRQTIYFDMLADVMVNLIDDGEWIKASIEKVGKAKPSKGAKSDELRLAA